MIYILLYPFPNKSYKQQNNKMAGIDKTYIDSKDYSEYRQWWIDNYYKMLKELQSVIWLYTFSIFDASDITPEYLKTNKQDLEAYKNSYDFAIWNTSETTDIWLIKNCSIPSFRDRMLQVYSHNWKGFKGQDWIPKPNKQGKKNR